MTVTLARTSASAPVTTVRALAWIEAKRFARHPLFLVGLAIATWGTWDFHSSGDPDGLMAGFPTSVFVGLFALVVAYRLTRSTACARDSMTAAPVSQTQQTAALCLACFVPAAAGLLMLVWHFVLLAVNPLPEWWSYGPFGWVDRAAVLLSMTAVAGLGGGLLGVAAGRWLRFPGASVLLVVAVIAEVLGSLSLSPIWGDEAKYEDMFGNAGADLRAGPATALRMFSPWTGWNNTTETHQDFWPGSPVWFLAWQLALCSLAATAAMLKGASGATRRTLLRWFGAVFAVAVCCYLLAVTGGLDDFMRVPRPPS